MQQLLEGDAKKGIKNTRQNKKTVISTGGVLGSFGAANVPQPKRPSCAVCIMGPQLSHDEVAAISISNNRVFSNHNDKVLIMSAQNF